MKFLTWTAIVAAIAIVLLATTVRVRFVDAAAPAVTVGNAAGRPIVTTRTMSPAALRLGGFSPSAGARLFVPVQGVARAQISNSWGDPRENGARAHHGTDIIAPRGTLIVAAAPGRVEKLFESEAGGTTAYVRSPAGKWSYYYAHMLGYAPGLHEGQSLRTGDPIGYVGDTGDAGPGNYHLHFGLTRMQPQDRWWEGEPVNPYPLLAARASER